MSRKQAHFAEALKVINIQFFIGAVGFFSLASRAMVVIIGFQVYRLTHNPAALGWLGLIEAIPAISLVLFGGYVADHFNRKRILLITRAVSCACALILAFLSLEYSSNSIFGLYAIIFIAGIARGFADPAGTAFEAQVVPKHLTVNAASWISSTWISCSVLGPIIIGFLFDAKGASACYFLIAIFFASAWICTTLIKPTPQPVQEKKAPTLKDITIGWRFVFKNQALWGALALDLFAVLFGGAIALLPIYADDILKVGAKGLGFLNAAPSLGALVTMLIATHHPPIHRAGRNLLLAVAGFGVSILVFAFSKNFALSLAALFMSGVFDGVSVVIRRSMIRLLSPDRLRGRIAAVAWVFISTSNEIGAFESGMLASFIGTVPCVAVGGAVTLLIVFLTSRFAPELRRLTFDVETLEQKSQ